MESEINNKAAIVFPKYKNNPHIIGDDINSGWYYKRHGYIQRWKDEQEENQQKELDGLTFPDIRNKLTPITNLIAMIKSEGISDALHKIIEKEIKQAEESIKYLCGNKK